MLVAALRRGPTDLQGKTTGDLTWIVWILFLFFSSKRFGWKLQTLKGPNSLIKAQFGS